MGERIESEGHYEMLYRCDHCDTKDLLAKSQRYCPECGAAQNPDKRYFPEEGSAVRVEGHQYGGADRLCPACQAPQSAKANNCTQCGSALDGAKEVRGVVSAPPRVVKKRRRQWKVLLVVGILAAIVFAIWWFAFRTKDAQLAITGHRWERSIGVEEYGEKHDEDWRDHLPTDATSVRCVKKERSKKKVETGEENCTTDRHDKKDGTYELIKKCTPVYREEPVDDEWCRYTVQRWKPLDPVKANGVGMSPAWPTAELPPVTGVPVLGTQRQGKHVETYILEIQGQPCEVSEAIWRKYADGQRAKVEVRASSGNVVCDSL